MNTSPRYIVTTASSDEGHFVNIVDLRSNAVISSRKAENRLSASTMADTIAEIQTAELNATGSALDFVTGLILHIDELQAMPTETAPTDDDIVQDIQEILKWYMDHITSATREPIDQTKLFRQAPFLR